MQLFLFTIQYDTTVFDMQYNLAFQFNTMQLNCILSNNEVKCGDFKS